MLGASDQNRNRGKLSPHGARASEVAVEEEPTLECVIVAKIGVPSRVVIDDNEVRHIYLVALKQHLNYLADVTELSAVCVLEALDVLDAIVLNECLDCLVVVIFRELRPGLVVTVGEMFVAIGLDELADIVERVTLVAVEFVDLRKNILWESL